MKLKKDFTIYNMADDYMLIPIGKQMSSFGGTIVLNEVSAFLLAQMKDEHKTIEQLVAATLDEYDIDEKTAMEDITEAIDALKQAGVIEENPEV